MEFLIKKEGKSRKFTFRGPHEILARTSRNQEVINLIPRGICGVKKVRDLGKRGPLGSPPAIPITVKLGNKERFDKEQIGIKEPFPVTNLPFTL